MFERFTGQARRVVVLAQEEARSLNHDYIGTEHVLLGLLREGDAIAAHALAGAGVSLDAVRAVVREAVPAGRYAPSGHIPFTPRAKKVLEFSLREALQLGQNFIGPEHLLLGLIREGDGVGAQVLARLGGGLAAVRAEVIARRGQQPPESAEPPQDERPAGTRRPGTLRGVVAGREVFRLGAFAGDRLPAPAHAADPVVPRPAESARLLEALGRRDRNNALIVGPSGAGKSALARGLADLFAPHRAPAALGHAELLEVDLLTLRTFADRLLRRTQSPVALVEDLDTLLAADAASGGRMVAALSDLAGSGLPCVVTGTGAARDRLERTFPALAARFTAVELPAAGPELTLEILRALRPGLAGFHRIEVEDSALAAAVELGAHGAGGRVLPGAAVDVLDAAAARLSAAGPQGSGGGGDISGGGRISVLDAALVRESYRAERPAGAAGADGDAADAGGAGPGGNAADGPQVPPGPPAAA